MNGFFKPLRRKIGVVTLALACVFAAGWVRSLYIMDQFRYGNLSRTPFMVLQNGPPGRFILDCCNMLPSSRKDKFEWRSHPTPEPVPNKVASTDVLGFFFYRWVAGPREIASDGYQQYSRFGFALHHRTIVIPLTLLSAWLLLSRPRSKTPSGTALAE